jgi:hypothetical protein
VLSLHLCLVILWYMWQLLKCWQSVMKKMALFPGKEMQPFFIPFINILFYVVFCWPALLKDTYLTWIQILTSCNIVNYALEYATLCEFILQIFMKRRNNGWQYMFGNPLFCIKILHYVVDNEFSFFLSFLNWYILCSNWKQYWDEMCKVSISLFM